MEDQELERLRRELRERDEFLAFVAHELRNPLHTIGMQLASARLATRQEGDGQLENIATRIRKAELSLKRYSERVILLLDLAQHSLHAFTPQPASADLAGFLRALTMQSAADAEYHAARLEYDGPVAAVVITDIRAIEHIVSNLVSNALKYANASLITTSLKVEPGQFYEIAVTDDGAGVAADQQAKIFEKFQRGSTELSESGFGLGLWIVSQLAQALQGTVRLSSETGKGCRFTITIPIKSTI